MKKVLNILLAAGLILSLTACGNTQKETEATIQPPTVASPTQPQTTTSVSTETPKEKTAPTEQAQEEQNMTLQMTIGSTPVSVSWEDNDAVQALKELCRNQPLTISMSMYGGFEQVGSIGTNLPANDVQTTTSAGDIVLYSGNQMVVFYGSNSWAYTRLGHITDQSADGMTQLLSGGDTTITITLE